VPLSSEQLDALVMAQVGWLELSEEGRKVLRTHLDTERKPGNRHAILRLRSAQGPLTCDACRISLAERYGMDHAEVVELHHLLPLARGIQKPKGVDDFALLCPTCHRVVHYRREEPLKLEEVRRRLALGS
jgi:5-methylcytosine-specific restriction protein A